MAEVATLKLRIDSREAKTAASDLDRLGKASKSAEKEAATLGRAYQAVGRVFGLVAASVVAREVIQAADAYKNLSARLQLVSRTTSEFLAAQEGVFNISQRTRISLGQTSDLYTSLARSTEALGVSQEDLLKVTEGINQALIISGTSAASAQAALTQLGQGFASGVLRGEELNSVLEQAPRLARALADGLGVPVGKLRELGQAGELTADKVFRALQKSGAALESEFKRLPTTVEQATVQAGNSISRLIGLIDDATGATSALAGGLSAISRGLDALGDMPKLAELAGLASDLTEANEFLTRLKAAKESPWAPLIPNLDAQLAEAERKFAEARRRFKIADGRLGTSSADDQTGAEGRRLGILPPTFVPEGEKQKKTKRRPPDPDAPVFVTYAEQITQRVGSLLEDSDVTRAKVYADTLQKLDALYFDGALSADLYESSVKKLTGSTSSGVQTASEFIKEQERLAELLAGTESAGIEKQRKDIELLQRALASGAINLGQYAEAIRGMLNSVTDKTKTAKSFAEEFGLSFSSAFEDAVVKGNKLSDVLKGLADDILRIILRKQVTEPLGNALAKGIDFEGFFKGLFPSAKGNVFQNAPGLSAYSGSVVTKPTIFPFASGAGLMGEAGEEGIFPLKRGKDGKLGVSADGVGGVSVTIINNSGTPVQATAQQRGNAPDGTQILEVVLSAVGDALANRTGPVARGLEGGYGVRPTIY
ncbi:MAG: tape measure protein [Hydrogenophaga sp.]|nr:tape measure protein [Hydrogenophaga sp.]